MSCGRTSPGLMVGQGLHFSCLVVLLALVGAAWDFLGRPCPTAFWAAIAVPVIHQFYVWLAWRIELRSAGTSRSIGFKGYVALFFLLFTGRFVTLFWLAWLDQGSLGIPMVPRVALAGILLLIGGYAMYSVMRYFGMARAAGADHFDRKYREMPLVREGIFRFTSNGMYLYAFLLFWAIAAGFDSMTALVVTVFSHLYIWIHFFATEKPDMTFLYSIES